MTYEGWFSFGGNEIANNPRAFGIARTAACPMGWIKRQGCATLEEALGDDPYTHQNVSQAPWYDSTIEASSRFYGLYVLDFGGVRDSTGSAAVTQNAGDAGQIGTTRYGTRDVKVKAQLFARGEDALEYGRAWLNAALRDGACGQHGTSCGVTDVEYFAACPPTQDGMTDDEYAATIDGLRRYLHDVAVTSWPFTTETMVSGQFYSDLVEWTFTSERPWVYHKTRDVDLPSVASSVVTDIPINLARYPSAEVSSGSVLLGTNLFTNPSLETNATGWTAGATAVSGTSPAAFATNGRVTGERAGSGAASMRSRILGSGAAVASGVAELSAYGQPSVAAVPANGRISVSAWAYLEKVDTAPATVLNSLRAYVRFFNGSSVQVGTDVPLGTITDPLDFAGHIFSARGIQLPAGAATARVVVVGNVNWVSAASAGSTVNSDVRLYVDALAVTTP